MNYASSVCTYNIVLLGYFFMKGPDVSRMYFVLQDIFKYNDLSKYYPIATRDHLGRW